VESGMPWPSCSVAVGTKMKKQIRRRRTKWLVWGMCVLFEVHVSCLRYMCLVWCTCVLFEVCESCLRYVCLVWGMWTSPNYTDDLYLNYWSVLWSNVWLQSAHILSMPLIYISEKYVVEQWEKLPFIELLESIHCSCMSTKGTSLNILTSICYCSFATSLMLQYK
jgi:hypothetical protein